MSTLFSFSEFTTVTTLYIILFKEGGVCILEKENDYIISLDTRKILGDFIKKKRELSGFGLNQISLKGGISKALWSRLENAKLSKINPFLLQKVGRALNIDYKELYKIVGFLDKNEIIKDSFIVQQNSHTGDIIVGNNSTQKVITNTASNLDLEGLSPEQIEEVKKYIEFLKVQNKIKGK